MAGFKDEPFRRLLNIPVHEEPFVVVAVGYEGNLEDADPAIREKEARPRTRKEISEVVTIVN